MSEFGVEKIYFPPKYNLEGNRQVWFIELKNPTITNLLNGVLTGVLLMIVIVGSVYLGKVV